MTCELKRGGKVYRSLRALCRRCFNERERLNYQKQVEAKRIDLAEKATRPGPPAKVRIGRPQYERWLREMAAEVRTVSEAR